MKRVFVFLPLCLAACAPALTAPQTAEPLPLGSVGCGLDLEQLASESGQSNQNEFFLLKSSCPLSGGKHSTKRVASDGPHEHCVSVVNRGQDIARTFFLSGNFEAGRVYQRPEAYQGKMIKVMGGEKPQFLDLDDDGVSSTVLNGVAGYRVRIDGLPAGESVSVCTVVAVRSL